MSDTGQRPDDRAFNRRERLADECEERAREEAALMVGDTAAMFRLLSELEEVEQVWLASTLVILAREEMSGAKTPIMPGLKQIAYRRALAAERRKEGLE